MRHQAILIVLLFLAAACGSSEDSPSKDADGSGGSSGTGGRASSNGGSGSGGSTGSVGSGTGGIAANGSGGTSAGSGGTNGGTGGRFSMGGDGGMMMTMCPATMPTDGSMCQGGGRRGMSCDYADQECRCRRGTWSCDDGMQSGDDGGMN